MGSAPEAQPAKPSEVCESLTRASLRPGVPLGRPVVALERPGSHSGYIYRLFANEGVVRRVVCLKGDGRVVAGVGVEVFR